MNPCPNRLRNRRMFWNNQVACSLCIYCLSSLRYDPLFMRLGHFHKLLDSLRLTDLLDIRVFQIPSLNKYLWCYIFTYCQLLLFFILSNFNKVPKNLNLHLYILMPVYYCPLMNKIFILKLMDDLMLYYLILYLIFNLLILPESIQLVISFHINFLFRNEYC